MKGKQPYWMSRIMQHHIKPTAAAWDGKRFYHFWRPITAIREGDNDGNPETAADATWTPQIATFTPPYPEYPSGANSLTGAMTRTLELFFGDRMTFSVMSAFVNQTKTYHRFSDMLTMWSTSESTRESISAQRTR
jgi:hypothetical protein